MQRTRFLQGSKSFDDMIVDAFIGLLFLDSNKKIMSNVYDAVGLLLGRACHSSLEMRRTWQPLPFLRKKQRSRRTKDVLRSERGYKVVAGDNLSLCPNEASCGPWIVYQGCPANARRKCGVRIWDCRMSRLSGLVAL
jgi:hypothetical protein